MINSIAHVCTASKDLSATENFYINCLGFKKKFDFLRANKCVGFYLEVTDKSYIEIFLQTDLLITDKAPIRHLCLETSNIDAVITRLRECGYEATDKKLGADKSWQTWTKDPDGVRIEFHQYTEESSQNTGVNCILG